MNSAKTSPSHDADTMKEKLTFPMGRSFILTGQSGIVVALNLGRGR